MSADNWTVCPICIKKLKKKKDEFVKKHYGKLDPVTYDKILKEFERKIEHFEKYGEGNFEPNSEVAEIISESDDLDIWELTVSESTGTPLEEWREYGVDSKGLAYCSFTGECQKCGASWSISVENLEEGETFSKDLKEVAENYE